MEVARTDGQKIDNMTIEYKWQSAALNVDKLRYRVAQSKYVFDIYLGHATKSLFKNRFNEAIVFAEMAGNVAWNLHMGSYASPPLEDVLIHVAQNIDKNEFLHGLKFLDTSFSRLRIMHVLSGAYAVGGHARVVERWINNTKDESVHGIVVTRSNKGFPKWLTKAAQSSGGWVYNLEDESSEHINRAVALKNIARKWADLVVLHTHPSDPLPIVAFGVDEGPPVVLYNHADHLFWLGACVADVVADIRPSGHNITMARRGVKKSKILPIPLQDIHQSIDRDELRNKFGVNKDSVVLLSIASEYKYTPLGAFDFLKIHKNILDQHKNAVMFVVGPENHGAWADYKNSTNGRVHALGIQHDLRPFHAISDIYVDSTPFGSLTSMLEAGQYNMPGVGIKNSLSPILSSDDLSLDRCGTHFPSLEEYEHELHRLIDDASFRKERGYVLGKSINADHLFNGWKLHLDKVYDETRCKHVVFQKKTIQDEVSFDDLYLSYFQEILKHEISKSLYMEGNIRYLSATTRYHFLLENIFKKGIFNDGRVKTRSFIHINLKRFYKKILKYN